MKILIIKTGNTETFDLSNIHQEIVSLGDVVRTTVICHLFKDHQIYWFTGPEAYVLLEGLEELKAVYTNFDQIELSEFDLIVNLERGKNIMQVLLSQPVKKVLGFIENNNEVLLKGSHFSMRFEDWLGLPEIRNKNWSEKLFIILGYEWSKENYMISTKFLDRNQIDTFDVGLNWKVGIKWPSKSWPMTKWEELESRINPMYKVSWQVGFDNLVQYVNWINSVKILVTHDSLGLHIANALNKKIIALFGPTSSKEIHLGEGTALSEAEKNNFSCPPCYKSKCNNNTHCMDVLHVDEVEKNLKFHLEAL